MRRLMLLRHAKSDHPAGVADHDRQLTARGRRDSSAMGRYMAEEGLVPDLAIVSTARRTQETWELVDAALGRDVLRHDERRIYEASTSSLLAVINKADPLVASLLLVGHNPGVHDLALRLVGPDGHPDQNQLHQQFPTAGLVVIDFDTGSWSDVTTSLGKLERFVQPKSDLD